MFCDSHFLWNDAGEFSCTDARSVGNFDGHGRRGWARCIEMTSIDFNALDVDAFTKGSKSVSKDSGGTSKTNSEHPNVER